MESVRAAIADPPGPSHQPGQRSRMTARTARYAPRGTSSPKNLSVTRSRGALFPTVR